ncbi:BON1-associated protein 2-like [Cornus florida]|uniref:BON1-associated protein 2-like n=1 Tax=Cornus florida TaxID=4283 RepID=UPI00289E719C|nr:BON1-associated protein 2-like [Cornus florida]
MSRAIEITVISGEGLRTDRKRSVKKNAFVVVRTDSGKAQMSRLDTEGGSYPVWNEKLAVDMPVHARFVTVEVQCRTGSGDKLVGAARIPATDFVGGYTPDNYLHFLSYRLRDGNGERNGIINLSVKTNGPENSSSSCAASCSRPWMATPAADRVSSGVVTGVPVPYY